MSKYASVIILMIIISLSACSTKQYRQQKDICSLDGYKNYPVTIEKEIREGTKTIRVPTDTYCYERSYGRTSCETLYKNEYIPYTYVEEVDINSKIRRDFIKGCTRNNCIRIYGNPRCKVKKDS